MNKRRKLIVALGASALTSPFASFAQQQGKVWRVGVLTQRNRPVSLDADVFGAFQKGMRDLGYVEGRNLVIEWRFAEGRVELLPGLAAELVRLQVDAIVVAGTPATRALQKLTATIPIVTLTGDPVGDGFVKSLARPGGNITGLSSIADVVEVKNLEMLARMVPKLARVAVLTNPDNSSHATILKSMQAAIWNGGIQLLPVEARTSQEIEGAFSRMARENAGAVLVASDPVFQQQWRQIAELAAKHRLPSITRFREYPDAGGLMSYGSNIADRYRRVAYYVDKIFKGAKPADLPVEQPTLFELVINGKAAKALGLKIPQSLLIMADKVIE